MTVLLIGCGRMGGALARAWVSERRVLVYDPGAAASQLGEWLVELDPGLVPVDAIVVLAVKPQVFPEVAPALAALAGRFVLSIMAGVPLSALAEALGGSGRIVRAMPNTPAALGKGITALIGASALSAKDRTEAEALMRAGGEVVWLDRESDLDAVTALSGSGPAYFFRFTEALVAAGVAQGLSADLATGLARATFTGAAALAGARSESLADLRAEVTSPGGTTAAGLSAFDEEAVIDRLLAEVVRRAAGRSRELSG